MNRWLQFVKDYAKKHKMSYSSALKCASCKSEYNKKYKISGRGAPPADRNTAPPPPDPTTDPDDIDENQQIYFELQQEYNEILLDYQQVGQLGGQTPEQIFPAVENWIIWANNFLDEDPQSRNIYRSILHSWGMHLYSLAQEFNTFGVNTITGVRQ